MSFRTAAGHILKHLPAFELLEFKDWWSDLNALERESINIIYFLINKALKEVFKNSQERGDYSIKIMPDDKAKYQITLILGNKNSDFAINLLVNKNNSRYTNEYAGLNKLESIRIQQLFDCFIKEIFIYSNFQKYNTLADLETYSHPIVEKDGVVRIHSAIKNTKNQRLIYNYKDFMLYRNNENID